MRSIIFVFLIFLVSCDFGSDKSKDKEETPTNGDLVITEISSNYYSNSAQWIEVYNKSATENAYLRNYKLRSFASEVNSPYTFNDDTVTEFDLPDIIIPKGSYAIITGVFYDSFRSSGSVAAVRKDSYTPNGYDSAFYELILDGETKDFVRFGTCSVEPVTSGEWDDTTAPALVPGASESETYGKSITRDPSNTDTNSGSDWVLNNFSTPGGPNDILGSADADGDGIPDANEVAGTTYAGLPLYDWGARPGQKDVFIHVAYMNSDKPGIKPVRAALDKVESRFYSKGIRLHFDCGNLFGTTPASYNHNLDNLDHSTPYAEYITFGKESGKANLYEYKYRYMNLAKKNIFYFLMMANAHNSSGSGGLGEVNGNDFICSIGSWNLSPASVMLTNLMASVIMHEFGHNLGLRHGGDTIENYKPNYFSIMNYLYQVDGLPDPSFEPGSRYYGYRANNGDASFKNIYFPNTEYPSTTYHFNYYSVDYQINFSDGTGASIDETNINESIGIGRSTGKVDYNGDNDTSDIGLSFDINPYDHGMETAPGKTVITDYNDWANLKFIFCRQYSGAASGNVLNKSGSFYNDPIGDDEQEVVYETNTMH